MDESKHGESLSVFATQCGVAGKITRRLLGTADLDATRTSLQQLNASPFPKPSAFFLIASKELIGGHFGHRPLDLSSFAPILSALC
jgi:hypothetical protein